MILSVSRRTDIPAFFSEWFFNRVREKYVLVRNPLNYRQVSKVTLNPGVVDCIVFWTKKPSPLLYKLDLLSDYNYYFQVTITPYDREIEPGLPDKHSVIKAFRQLSARIGREKVIWRYDPIILTNTQTIEYHCRSFAFLADELHQYTNLCIISFVDLYKKMEQKTKKIALQAIDHTKIREIAERLAEIACKYNLKLETCSEWIDLSSIGIGHANVLMIG